MLKSLRAAHIFAVFVLLTSTGQTETIHLKDGKTVVAKSLRRSGPTVMATVEVTGSGAAEVGYPIDKIAKIDFPEPPALKSASDLVSQGKTDAALPILEPILTSSAPFKDLPGSWWSRAALLKVSALQNLQREKEAEPLINDISTVATDPDAAALARIRLGTSLSRRQQPEKAIEMYDAVIKQSTKPAVLAEAWVEKGHALLALKQYDSALLAYLHLPVFYEEEKSLQPAALLGSGRAYARLEDFERARATLNELMKDYPSAPEAATARIELQKVEKEAAQKPNA